MDIKDILKQVERGEISADEAALKIKMQPFVDIGYAKLDMQRKLRQGAAEVIYGEGKTAAQISGIIQTMKENGQDRILVTRLSKEKADEVAKDHAIDYSEISKTAVIGGLPEADGLGKIVVLTAGTSDIPVAEEAAVTAELLGNAVERVYDVGVAGLHRLLSRLDVIMNASVIIAVAGMEGALASVVGGLADCPVIAVPTSVGYGSSFNGLTALLAMLNSCASNVSVVNIDNGFGAGFQASRINHMEVRR